MKNKLNNLDILVIAYQLNTSEFEKIKNNLLKKKKYLFLAIDPKTQIFLKKNNEKFITSSAFLESVIHRSILIESQKILSDYDTVINLIRIDNIHDCFKNFINYHLLFKIRQWLMIYFMIRNIKMKQVISVGLDVFLSNTLFRWCKKENIEFNQRVLKRNRFNIIKIVVSRLSNIFLFELLLIIYKIFYKNKNKNQLLATSPERNLSEVVKRTNKFKHRFLPVYLTSSPSFFFENFSLFIRGKIMIFKRTFSYISPKYQKEFICFKKNISKAVLLIDKINSNENEYKYLEIELNIFLRKFLYNDVVDLFRSYVGLKKINQNNGNNLLFLAQHALGFNGLVGEFSCNESFLSILITHGSHVKQTNKFSRLGWAETNKILINAKFTFSAIQTPLAYEYFKNEINQKSKPLITGPLIFGVDKKKYLSRKVLYEKHSKKFIFLHAGTPKEWNYFRPIVYETIDEYIQNLIDIIDAVKNIKNSFLAIRFREMNNLKLSELKELLPKENCYQIFTDKTFCDYLINSDFLISYSSTTIEESLINKKPVVLYNPKNQYLHLKGTQLNKKKSTKHSRDNLLPIYNINNKKDLTFGLNYIQNKFHNKNVKFLWNNFLYEKGKRHAYENVVNKYFQSPIK